MRHRREFRHRNQQLGETHTAHGSKMRAVEAFYG
jgi:hypothetical protein